MRWPTPTDPLHRKDKVEITLTRSGTAGAQCNAHASPHVVIVVFCGSVNKVRADCSQLEFRPGGCTHEQQEPRRLRVIQPRNPLARAPGSSSQNS